MAYADVSSVSKITGLSTSEVKSVYLHMADNYVEELLGYDMDQGHDNQIDYFDVTNRNQFVVEYDRERSFVLTRKPVIQMISVHIDPYGTNTELTYNVDYTLDYENAIVIINKDTELPQGSKMLKVRYSWGCNDSVPLIVIDYANYLCSMLHELGDNIVKNVDGKPLKEIELGRWRELYDISGTSIKAKYSMLSKLEEMIVNKYKIWD